MAVEPPRSSLAKVFWLLFFKKVTAYFLPLVENSRRSVSRVLSTPLASAGRPFLWDAPCGAPRATNPGGGSKTFPCSRLVSEAPAAPIRSCSRWGLPCQPCYQGCGALLPPRFTLTIGEPMAVCFLWHYPWGRPRRPLAGTVFPWSPDFPPAGFYTRQRPSNRLESGRCAAGCQSSSRARKAAARPEVLKSTAPVMRSGRKRR